MSMPIVRNLIVLSTLLFLSACWTAQPPLRTLSGENWPDPSVIKVNGTFYTYATNTGGHHVPVRESTAIVFDGPVAWSGATEAFPEENHPSWIKECDGDRHIWGPTVVRAFDAQLGWIYYLYYSAAFKCDTSEYGEHAIGVAFSGSPTGPFVAIGSQPLLADPWDRGVIDPEIQIVNGTWYLVYSTDWGPNGVPSGTQRYIDSWRMTAPDTLDSINSPGAFGHLLTADANSWEDGVVEAPAIVVRKGVRFLFYSGGVFSQNYATDYAVCTSPVGPCNRNTPGTPWITTGWNGLTNPGGAEVFKQWNAQTQDDTYLMFFHELENSKREMMTSLIIPDQ